MADVADVMDALASMAQAACFPDGAGNASVTGKPIDVAQGWPLVEDIDAAMAEGRSLVSVYLIPGSTRLDPQIFDWSPGTVVEPVHGLTATVDELTATLSGTANVGEYATLIVTDSTGQNVFSYTATTPTVSTAMAAELLELVQADYPDATLNGAALSFPSSVSVVLRIGAKAVIGQKIHRQEVQFQIVTWAPNPSDRTTIGKAVDVAIKTPVKIAMPDTSVAIIHPRDTRLSDREENKTLYRRDMILSVMFDTIQLIPAYEVTSVKTTLNTVSADITQNQ